MSDAVRLRAQKAYSTDPEYLERMALEAEARDVRNPRLGVDRQAATPASSKPYYKHLVVEKV